MKKPVILMILDGFGIAPEKGNAIKAAKKPNIDKLFASNPLTQIGASGMDVGLPDGQMGNSEVGHTNMGAGRIVYQELTRITKTINEDKLKDNEAIVDAMDKALKNGTALHLMGLLSDGGVHSHIEHLYGILELAKKKGLKDVYIHAFLDGRDVPPSSAAEYADKLLNKLKEIGIGKVATVEGRYYAMDRDNNWDRVEKAYAAMVYGEGNKADCPVCAIKNSYNDGVTDEFVVPCVIEGGAQVKPNDSIIFFNFRPDRAREITRTFVDPDFKGFERKNGFFPVNFVCMTQYDATMPNVEVAFKPEVLKNTLGEYVSDKGMTQLRIAETEKYAHVTFFFNGGVEKQYPAVKAVEAVDTCVGKVVDAIKEMGGVALITADHGNADKMVAEDGSPFTAHTTNPVPFCVVNYDCELREGGRLADIAPTMLQIMGLEQPEEMDGTSLIK